MALEFVINKSILEIPGAEKEGAGAGECSGVDGNGGDDAIRNILEAGHPVTFPRFPFEAAFVNCLRNLTVRWTTPRSFVDGRVEKGLFPLGALENHLMNG